VGVALVGLLGALALPMLAAGAQTTTTIPVDVGGNCVVTVPPPTTVDAGAQVTIAGSAPEGVTVVLFANGQAAEPTPNTTDQTVVVVGASGQFELRYTPTATVTLSVNFITAGSNAYTAVCADNAGRTNFPVTVNANEANKPKAQALAFTGSSDTPSYVLIGIAAVVVGAVLVVAARRRRQVS
jgi:LPXTG-motif cell wall-anchored protein